MKTFFPRGVECRFWNGIQKGPTSYSSKPDREIGPDRPRITTVGGYLLSPLEIRDGRVRLTFLGNAKQVRGLIQMFEKAGARYKVVSISDAMFSPTSPLNRLTEKQLKVIIASYR